MKTDALTVAFVSRPENHFVSFVRNASKFDSKRRWKTRAYPSNRRTIAQAAWPIYTLSLKVKLMDKDAIAKVIGYGTMLISDAGYLRWKVYPVYQCGGCVVSFIFEQADAQTKRVIQASFGIKVEEIESVPFGELIGRLTMRFKSAEECMKIYTEDHETETGETIEFIDVRKTRGSDLRFDSLVGQLSVDASK